MDELGSAPRIQFGDNDQYTTDADQNGSWFGLAISGLKFLINNQHNNNINHAVNPPQSSGTNNSTSSSSYSANFKAQNQQNSKRENNGTTQKPKKLHILGPSMFKKQLYDIPEYQSTTDKNKGNKRNKRSIRTSSKLTKQALAQFNGNFTNYWNQRSSLHSHYGSSNGDHADDDMTSNAGSHATNQSHGANTNNTRTSHGALTDGGDSTIQHEHNPSMTSSQIIHPTQDKPPKLSQSRSFPLLHSAEYIQDFQKFTFTEDKDIDNEMEGIMNIPSPPPISSTPDINQSILLPKLKNVHALKSWESVNNGSVKSFPDDNSMENGMQAFTDGKLLTSGQGQMNASLTQLIVSDDHFIKEKQKSSKAQKQWLRQNVNAMKSKQTRNSSIDSSFSVGSTNTNTTAGLVHVHQEHGSKTQSELDWTECHDTTIGQVISNPIPKSIKKKNKNKKKKKYNDNGNDSDWSQVSSNMGVTTPTTPHTTQQ